MDLGSGAAQAGRQSLLDETTRDARTGAASYARIRHGGRTSIARGRQFQDPLPAYQTISFRPASTALPVTAKPDLQLDNHMIPHPESDDPEPCPLNDDPAAAGSCRTVLHRLEQTRSRTSGEQAAPGKRPDFLHDAHD